MTAGSLNALFPQATLRIVTHFLLHPKGGLHFRALQRHLGLSVHSLQREVSKLERMGLVRRHEEKRRVYYAPVRDHPTWDAFLTLVREHADPVDVLRDALSDVEGIAAAFVFGSFARGDAREDSDVDLFVVTDQASSMDLARAVLEAQALLDREVAFKRVVADRVKNGGGRSGFEREVLSGPKKWVVGSPAVLRTGGGRE